MSIFKRLTDLGAFTKFLINTAITVLAIVVLVAIMYSTPDGRKAINLTVSTAGQVISAVIDSIGGLIGSGKVNKEADDREPAPRSQVQVTLDSLVVAPQQPDGYSNAFFGPRWVADTDQNGCDTRNDILNRDLTQVQHKPGTKNCVVTSGILNDPYTGKTITFVRGVDTSTAVQIDHVVSRKNGYATGARYFDDNQRALFDNDPENLLAVDGPTNQNAKKDKDASGWLPENKSFVCTFAQTQVNVKAKYGLWVTPEEKSALAQALATCPL